MSRGLLFFLAGGLSLIFTAHAAPPEKEYLSAQEFMVLNDGKARWGDKKKFDAGEFKTGTTFVRSSMAVDLIRSKKMLGKTSEEVKNALGAFTGFFWSDYLPTYIVEEGWADGKDTWQLVFLLNEVGKVRDVRIHKNCCSSK